MSFLSGRCCLAIRFALSLAAAWIEVGTALARHSQEPPEGTRPAIADQVRDPLPPAVIARLGRPPVQHNQVITCLAFAPDGKTLLSGSMDSSFSFWDVATGNERRRLDFGIQEYLLAISPSCKRLVTVPETGTLALRELDTGKVLR